MPHRFAPLSMYRLVQAVRLDQLPAYEQRRWEQAARTLPRAALPADPAGWPATTDAVNRNGDRSNVGCTRAAVEVPPDLGRPPLIRQVASRHLHGCGGGRRIAAKQAEGIRSDGPGMRSEVTAMIAKRVLVVGGLVAALAVPAGVAVAAAATSAPGPAPATTQPSQPGPGYGPGSGLGYGPMMGDSGGPRGCPYYNSPQMQQWRDQRHKLSPAERQKLMQQHRAWMWAQRTGATSS